MRLIDADLLEPDADYDDGEFWAVSMGQIQDAPTIEERPTGEWIVSESEEVGALGIRYRTYTCPSCGWNHSLIIPGNFCPNCGSDNRGKE